MNLEKSEEQLLDECNQANEEGYLAAMTGQPESPAPKAEDFENTLQYRRANFIYQFWLEGYRRGLENFSMA